MHQIREAKGAARLPAWRTFYDCDFGFMRGFDLVFVDDAREDF